MMIDLSEVYKLVKEAHTGQKYGKHDYMYHINQVYSCVSDFVDDTDVDAIALCHDLLEDTEVTYIELVELIGVNNANSVKLLSKNYCVPYSYEKYIHLIKTDKKALIVKKADTLCNLTESVKLNDIKRIKKYTKQLEMLCED